MSVVKKLFRDYGDFCIDIPEMEILDHGITALWGASGAGKSSVLKILLGLEPEARFEWWWGSENLAKLSPPDRRLAIVFQSYDLFPHLTARENILFPAQARKIELSEAQARLKDLTEKLQIQSILDRTASVLSGGERQRVALARALMVPPRMVFLDEPFSSLDAGHKKESRTLVLEFLKAEKVPALLITHDPEDLRHLAQKVIHLEQGRLKTNSEPI